MADKQYVKEVLCTNCGQSNRPSFRYCHNCGAQLNPASLSKSEPIRPKSIWRPWGDYPPVVIIASIAGLIAIFVFVSTNVFPELKAFFEGLPGGAREALDQFFADERRENPGFDYRITSAQKGTKPDFESGLLGALDHGYDEVWCVVIDPPIKVFGGFIISDAVNHFLVRRKGDLWRVHTIVPSPEYFHAAGCSNW